MSARPASSVPSTELSPGAGRSLPANPRPSPSRRTAGPGRSAADRQPPGRSDRYVPVAATHPQPPPGRLTRDMKKVPPSARPGPPPDRRPGADRGRRRPGRLLDRLQRRPDRHSELALPRRRSQHASSPSPIAAQSAAAHRRRRDDAAGRPRAAVRRLDPPAALTSPRSVAQPGRTQERGFSRLPAVRRDPRHEDASSSRCSSCGPRTGTRWCWSWIMALEGST